MRLLLENIFDYAGMFPPASLNLNDAMRCAASFPHTLTRPYLLASEIVLTHSNFEKISKIDFTEWGISHTQTFRVCVLGSALESVRTELTQTQLREIEIIGLYNSSVTLGRKVIAYEIKINGFPLLETPLHTQLSTLLESPQLKDVALAIEPDLSRDEWSQDLRMLCEIISELKKRFPHSKILLKVRGKGSAGSGSTGIGNDRLTNIIDAVCSHEILLKATAGLHHPIIEKDRYNNDLGFLNLLAALYLKRIKGSREFSDAHVLECLFTEDPKTFRFDDNGFAWKQFQVSNSDLAAAKNRFPISIGSCSLHEPDADLNRLFG